MWVLLEKKNNLKKQLWPCAPGWMEEVTAPVHELLWEMGEVLRAAQEIALMHTWDAKGKLERPPTYSPLTLLPLCLFIPF